MKKRFSVVTMVLLSLALTTSAFAADNQEVNVDIESGPLQLTLAQPINFGTIKLEAQPKTVTTGFQDKFNIVDARGTQEGYRLTVSATPFTEVTPSGGFAGGTSAFTLPNGTLSLKPVDTIERVGTGVGDSPSSLILTSTVIDDGAISLLTAPTGAGMGEFNLTFGSDALSIVVDSTTARIDTTNYSGGLTPYESTISWDLVSGP